MFKKLLVLIGSMLILAGCMEDRLSPPPVQEQPEEVVAEEPMEEETAEEENVEEEESVEEEIEETVEEEEEAEELEPEESEDITEDEIGVFKAALIVEHPTWEENNFNVIVDFNDGDFAQGGVTFEEAVGGGMWLAAYTADEWVIIWDGNGTIGCADIEPYHFPVDRVSECWDEETQVMVDRSETAEDAEESE